MSSSARLQKLIDLATHEGTPVEEARSAAMAACRIMKANGPAVLKSSAKPAAAYATKQDMEDFFGASPEPKPGDYSNEFKGSSVKEDPIFVEFMRNMNIQQNQTLSDLFNSMRSEPRESWKEPPVSRGKYIRTPAGGDGTCTLCGKTYARGEQVTVRRRTGAMPPAAFHDSCARVAFTDL